MIAGANDATVHGNVTTVHSTDTTVGSDDTAQGSGDSSVLLELRDVSKVFDVSPPWLDRVLGGKPRACWPRSMA